MLMKAYVGKVYIEAEHNFERFIIYANTAFEANMILYQSGIISNAAIAKYEIYHEEQFDGREKASHYDITKIQWQLGWNFYGTNPPDPYIHTEDEFENWYKTEFVAMKEP